VSNLVVFLSGDRVGTAILELLTVTPRESLYLVINSPTSLTSEIIKVHELTDKVLYSGEGLPPWNEIARKIEGLKPVIGFSWFPFIYPKFLFELFDRGIINLHNSYLPYNRGRHSTFWAIMDGTPIGASLHWIEQDIDSGNVIDQIQVHPPEFANASMVYSLQLDACIQLASSYLSKPLDEISQGTPQNLSISTHHYAREISNATSFSSSSFVTWGDVVKLIRSTSTELGSITINYENGKSIKIWGKVIQG
jgi:methionyl-tRNA formyltransferase